MFRTFQRKFARESSDPKNDTYKKFRLWLDDSYTMGTPSNEQWEEIMKDDKEYTYFRPPSSTDRPEYEGFESEIVVGGEDFSDNENNINQGDNGTAFSE